MNINIDHLRRFGKIFPMERTSDVLLDNLKIYQERQERGAAAVKESRWDDVSLDYYCHFMKAWDDYADFSDDNRVWRAQKERARVRKEILAVHPHYDELWKSGGNTKVQLPKIPVKFYEVENILRTNPEVSDQDIIDIIAFENILDKLKVSIGRWYSRKPLLLAPAKQRFNLACRQAYVAPTIPDDMDAQLQTLAGLYDSNNASGFYLRARHEEVLEDFEGYRHRFVDMGGFRLFIDVKRARTQTH